MRLTLGQRLFRSFALLVAVVGALIALLGTWFVNDAVIGEARRHVRMNLRGAWSIYRDRLTELQCSAEDLAGDPRVVAIASGTASARSYAWWDDRCGAVAPDVFVVTDETGRVILRGHAPVQAGDRIADDPILRRAQSGAKSAGTSVWRRARLLREDAALAAEAQIGATPSNGDGLMLVAAAPVIGPDRAVIGAVELGYLLNRKTALIDSIRTVFFQDGLYDEKPLGAVTIFLGDVRIATNARDANGRRAIGTRMSPRVYDRVIRHGRTWQDRALIVDSWYLTAYDPIVDGENHVVGALSVGLLERRYLDIRTRAIAALLGIAALGLVLSIAFSWVLARRMTGPLDRLAAASGDLRAGDYNVRVESRPGDDEEVARLTEAFDRMADALATRQKDLEEAIRSLTGANERLGEINRGYLDMLGFVSHELKGPLASILLNAYSLRDGMLGPVSEHQRKAAASMVRNLEYLEEMVRNYLDLTRIEQGRMRVQPQSTRLMEDVVAPAIESLERQVEENRNTLDRVWPEGDVCVDGDPQFLRIVWANLIGNAVKYGREGGVIRIRATDAGDRWEFGVWNEGIGIAREKMGELFQKFHRLDQPGQPRRRGTGLGLFVTKEIVEQHGGTIRAESEEGRWVEFIFDLPKPACKEKDTGALTEA